MTIMGLIMPVTIFLK